MNKYLPLAAIAALFLISACTKSLEDRLIGSWKLDEAYRKVFLGRDHFTTGYEDGVFTFFENGNASYIGNGDTLNGYWRADNYTHSYYNNGSGQWDSRSMRYLRLHLINFAQNKFLDWEFDDFSFRNGHRTIKAEQYSISNDRVYEFVRQ
ncbi:MAG: hypothetical protein NTW29_09310 [Bacteroidetes bacterium]|nr:hypothetical protein [Bacteroidota bacterium]